MLMRTALIALGLWVIALHAPLAQSELQRVPILYDRPAYQSPVRGEPDDLLLLAGYGLSRDDVVVYRALARTDEPLAHPTSIPAAQNADSGVAPIVSAADVPNGLVIRLPLEIRADQSYGLWIHTSAGNWSNGVRINDARPLWISPSQVHESDIIGGLPRYLKIIGRNLQASPGQSTRVRLTGPQKLTLTAAVTAESNRAARAMD